jgi:hypothetical protein
MRFVRRHQLLAGAAAVSLCLGPGALARDSELPPSAAGEQARQGLIDQIALHVASLEIALGLLEGSGDIEPSCGSEAPATVQALLRDEPLGYTRNTHSATWQALDQAASGAQLEVLLDDFAWSGELLKVRVDVHGPLQQLYVTLPEVSKKRVRLAKNRKSGLYEGKILVPLSYPREELTVRVVAQDRTTQQQLERELVLPVLFDGC